MNWQVVFSPSVEQDVAEAATWYERARPGLGKEFVDELISVWRGLAANPLLAAPWFRLEMALSGTVPVSGHLRGR